MRALAHITLADIHARRQQTQAHKKHTHTHRDGTHAPEEAARDTTSPEMLSNRTANARPSPICVQSGNAGDIDGDEEQDEEENDAVSDTVFGGSASLTCKSAYARSASSAASQSAASGSACT